MVTLEVQRGSRRYGSALNVNIHDQNNKRLGAVGNGDMTVIQKVSKNALLTFSAAGYPGTVQISVKSLLLPNNVTDRSKLVGNDEKEERVRLFVNMDASGPRVKNLRGGEVYDNTGCCTIL